MNVIEKLKQDIDKFWPHIMSKKIGVCYSFMYQIVRGDPKKIRHVVLDEIYQFYKVEKDEFYLENMKKWEPPTQSILWSLLRSKRHQKKMSVEDVARLIRWDARQIRRIEAGDSLPSYSSYYMTKFFEVYELNEEEKQTISWFIVILRDVVNLYNKVNDIVKK